MNSNFCPMYQPGLPTGDKCVLCYTHIREQLPLFGMKLPAKKITDVDWLCLGRHVPIQLWSLEMYSERDSTDSSLGLLLGIELTFKLREFWTEIIYI